jgi:preprotein translocase subunit SecD
MVAAEPSSQLETVVFEGETLHLEAVSVFTDSDLVQVKPSVDAEALLLHLELRPEAAERMGARTEDEIGGRLAIFVDGELRVAPEIMSAVGGTRVSMGFPATEEEAMRVAELIRAKWPPASSEPN